MCESATISYPRFGSESARIKNEAKGKTNFGCNWINNDNETEIRRRRFSWTHPLLCRSWWLHTVWMHLYRWMRAPVESVPRPAENEPYHLRIQCITAWNWSYHGRPKSLGENMQRRLKAYLFISKSSKVNKNGIYLSLSYKWLRGGVVRAAMCDVINQVVRGDAAGAWQGVGPSLVLRDWTGHGKCIGGWRRSNRTKEGGQSI
jgi:hypothetical protein